MKHQSPPNPPGNKNQSEERYEVPFEEQKAEQDRAEEIPALDEKAYHGVIGEIARKVEENSEADSRGVLGTMLVGCGNIIGRTACFRVNDTLHFCNEFACLVGNTARARKGLATDIVRTILGLVSSVWKEHCIAYGFSTGEGLVELVSDEVLRPKKKKDENGQPYFEPEIVKQAVADKRKLCLLSEFGELLTVMSREGNNLSMILRNAWDGLSPLEINTKQQPQRATGAHISIIGNITKTELLKLLPRVPNSDGFCNRFLWFLVRRLTYLPEGGPRVEDYLVKEISRLQKAIKFARSLTEIRRSPAAREFWADIYLRLSRATDMGRLVVDRAEGHTLRLSGLYAVLDMQAEIQPAHIEAAYALWQNSEACALRLFGVEDISQEAEKVLDYLRSKGPDGATPTELQHRVFNGHKSNKQISVWLRELEEKNLAWYRIERADNNREVERWFAHQHKSTAAPSSAPENGKKSSKRKSNPHQILHNGGSAKQPSEPISGSNPPNPPNPQEKQKRSSRQDFENHSVEDLEDLEDLTREAASVKASQVLKGGGFDEDLTAIQEKDSEPLHESFPDPYTYAATPEDVQKAFTTLQGVNILALDTETANDTLRLVQLSDGQSLPVILDAQKTNLEAELVPLLETKELIVQNSRFDLCVLKSAFGVDIPTERVFDTYIASALLTNTSVTQEERRRRKRRDWSPNRLESIVRRILGVELDKSHQDSDWSVDLTLPESASMLEYAANDVRYLHAVRLHLQGALETEGLLAVYELERDLIPCITEMSLAGLPIDVDALKRLYVETLEVTAKEEARLLKLLNREINPRSRKAQLLPALQALRLTVDGAPLVSTDKKVLALIDQADHPAAAAVLDWSIANEEAKQLKSWLALVDQEKGWVWPELNQFGTMTHRFVYKKPNMQQVKKSALRSIITAPLGELIVRADFKTLELIIAAVLYKETAILEQLHRGADLHTLTAGVLFHVPAGEVTKKQRSIGKVTNFSLLYGRSLEEYKRALRRAGVDMTEAEMTQAYSDFDLAWPNWAAHRKAIAVLIGRRTYPRETRSLYGRRILLDESLSNRELRGALLNYAIQSTASDMLKMTMLLVWKMLPEGVSILASVHDEVLLRARPAKVETAKALLKEAATEAGKRILKSDVPICLDVGTGKNWWEALQDEEEA